MNKFELTSAFLIGHKKLDSDHAELVGILNDMLDGFDAGEASICLQKWRLFCKKLEQHFIDELKIMDDFGYIEDDHKDDHQKILGHINNLGKESNSLDDWATCLFEVQNDLLSIILKHDLKFAEYLVTIGYNEV